MFYKIHKMMDKYMIQHCFHRELQPKKIKLLFPKQLLSKKNFKCFSKRKSNKNTLIGWTISCVNWTSRSNVAVFGVVEPGTLIGSGVKLKLTNWIVFPEPQFEPEAFPSIEIFQQKFIHRFFPLSLCLSFTVETIKTMTIDKTEYIQLFLFSIDSMNSFHVFYRLIVGFF